MEDSNQVWTQLGPFFPKSGHFFRFSKKGRGGLPAPPPPPSCVPALRVTLLILPIIWLTTLSSVKASFYIRIKILTLAVEEEIRRILLAKVLVIATSLIIPECRVDPLCQEFSGMREKRSSKACST